MTSTPPGRAGRPRFRERFGPDVPMVSPRFVLDAGTGRTIGPLRERLGREIGRMKGEPLDAGGSGVLRTLG